MQDVVLQDLSLDDAAPKLAVHGSLLDLPTETLEEILTYLPPLEIVKFQQVPIHHGFRLRFARS